MRSLLIDLKAFLNRRSVIELGVAFALATMAVSVIARLVETLVIYPIQHSAGSGAFGDGSSAFDDESGTLVIANRLFNYEDLLFELLIAVGVVAAAALVVRFGAEVLWDDTDMRDCPHCLSEIPAAASVCSHCTRAVEQDAT